MKPVFNYLYLVSAFALWLPGVTPANAEQATAKASRELLLKKPVDLPSKRVETKVIRVHFPVGYKTPAHSHDGPGPRYVLKGKLRVEDAGETRTYAAGDVFWETGATMTVENVGGSEADIVIFELAPAK